MPASATTRSLRLWDVLTVGGGLLVFLFSFAPFVRYANSGVRGELRAAGVRTAYNAWARETFMAPLTTFVILSALLTVGLVALRFGRGREPTVLGFRLRQFEVGLTLFAFVVLFGMIISNKNAIFGAGLRETFFGTGETGMVAGWGAVLMLLGAVTALAGAVLSYLGLGPVLLPRPTAPGPAAPPPPAPDPAAPG